MTQSVASLWVGGPLTPYEVLCMRSFLDHGVAYELYTYADISVPDGVTRRDAALICPEASIFQLSPAIGHGSFAPFSDLFRYELLLRHGGWWVDTDVACLRPELPGHPCFFALEAPGLVNCAVLKFPAGHAVMRDCRDQAVERQNDPTWGSTGPALLTAVLTEHGLLEQAASPESCYPIGWQDLLDLFDPDKVAECGERVAPAFALHLWNEITRRNAIGKFVAPPEGSFLDSLLRRHGIGFPQAPRHAFADIRTADRNRQLAEMVHRHTARIEELEQELAALRKPPAKPRKGRQPASIRTG
jgi:hypothetical protein